MKNSANDCSTGSFWTFFKSNDLKRDNFLARLFGLFNEQVVRAWCEDERATYKDLGRPTLYEKNGAKGWYTVDFLLQHRKTKKVFVSELKCEITWNNFKNLCLNDSSQLDSYTGKGFQKFLQFARDIQSLEVKVGGKPHVAHGAILVWGALTDQGRSSVMETTGVVDVLSVEHMIADLNQWTPEGWTALVNERQQWSNKLFDYLDGK